MRGPGGKPNRDKPGQCAGDKPEAMHGTPLRRMGVSGQSAVQPRSRSRLAKWRIRAAMLISMASSLPTI